MRPPPPTVSNRSGCLRESALGQFGPVVRVLAEVDPRIPVGEILGENTADAVLGLLNGACVTQAPFDYTMVNATLDTSQTVVFHDTDLDGDGQMFQDASANGNFVVQKDAQGNSIDMPYTLNIV